MNRRNFIQYISATMVALGLPRFRPKLQTINVGGSPNINLMFEHTNESWCDEPLVRLLGSTKDVEKWSVAYTDPRTNMLVIRMGEHIGLNAGEDQVDGGEGR